MPRGDKSAYTSKQKRQAADIEKSYESRGVSSKESERRAWATVNKTTGGGLKQPASTKSAGKKSTAKKSGAKNTTVEKTSPSKSTKSKRPAVKKSARKSAHSASR